jgi:hypothetical protein
VSDDDQRSPVERTVRRAILDETVEGQPLSRRARQTKRSVEQYLRGGVIPAYMRRLRDIDRELDRHRRTLNRLHRDLSARLGDDADAFAVRWRALAAGYSFDRVNALIREHNEWYPVERNLPLDPRTRDYVKIRGRSYRRMEVGADWVLEHFPPVPRPSD